MQVGSVSRQSAKAQLVKYIQTKLNTNALGQNLELHLRNGVMFCVKQKP
jgi:hypothetical protein